MRKLLYLLFAAPLVLACNQPAGTKEAAGSFNLDSVKAAIDANNAVLVAAIKKGDSASFVSCYTKDGCIMSSNMPKACGPGDMGKFLTGLRQMGIENLKITATEVFGGKELISEEGIFEILTNDGKTMDKGKYIVTWKQEDGKWKKYRDIFNSDMPPPPSPAPAAHVKK